MTIQPKQPKLTPAEQRRQEAQAYDIATGRDQNTCQRCLRDCGRGAISRDHRKGRGIGLTVASNLQVLGGTGTTGCHGWKTANPSTALAEGWSVPGWADPANWPATRYLLTAYGTMRPAFVLYDDRGGYVEISRVEAFNLSGGAVLGVAA
jgi:hypothetical protein